VLSGSVCITVGDEEIFAASGETVRYHADRPHSITNNSAELVTALMVNLLGPVTAAGQSLETDSQ
jgi:quercetin dioxygenase-like cupin family protein